MKRIKIILVSMCIFCVTVLNINANENIVNEEKFNIPIAERFKYNIDSIHEFNQSFKVLDSKGKDITREFKYNTKGSYLIGDYENIQKYMLLNDLIIEKNEIDENLTYNISNRFSKTYTKVILLKSSGYIDLTASIEYTISGSGTCDNRGNILSYSNAYLSKKEDPSNRFNEWYLINASCVTKNKGGYLQINSSFIPAWDYRYMDANVTTYKAAPVVNNFQWTPMY